MFKCVLVLAVLGGSTCFRRADFENFPVRPSRPSYSPSHWGSGHDGPHGAHPATWHHGYHDTAPWFNTGGSNVHGQKPVQSTYYTGQTGFYAQAQDSDSSDSDSGEAGPYGDVSNASLEQTLNPFRFNYNGSVSNQSQDQKPTELDKNSAHGNPNAENVFQVNNPVDINAQGAMNQNNGTLESKVPEQRNVTERIAEPNDKPFESDNKDLNRGDVPEAENKGTRPTKCNRPASLASNNEKLQTNQSKSNETVTLAYITGPDNTLFDLRAQTATNGSEDALKLNIEATARNESNPVSNDATTEAPDDPSTPTAHVAAYPVPRPTPSIGSIPVPFLNQLVAPSLQWHVGIYTKMETPYSQICGGSLVKTDVVISAAHCFWSDGAVLRPALFAAAAGKLQRAWDAASDYAQQSDVRILQTLAVLRPALLAAAAGKLAQRGSDAASDAYAQKSDIKEIHVPPRFHGAMTSFQDDLAVVKLSTPFEYGPGVQPVCVDFGTELENKQLLEDRDGTIVGWGLTQPNGPPSERLNYVQLPHLRIEDCIKMMEPSFLKYITSDKICAGGFNTGFAVCRGDSGGGLVYTTNGVPYLRGIVSTAPRNEDECNAYTPATFTRVSAHAMFLAELIPNIDGDCRSVHEVKKNVGTDGSRNGENVDKPTTNEHNQLTFNITIQSGDQKLQGPLPLPLTGAEKTFKCQCTFD